MQISQADLEKALDAFADTKSLMLGGEFVYKFTDQFGTEHLITRERVAALALQRFQALRKLLDTYHSAK